jgi:hypothetical protein
LAVVFAADLADNADFSPKVLRIKEPLITHSALIDTDYAVFGGQSRRRGQPPHEDSLRAGTVSAVGTASVWRYSASTCKIITDTGGFCKTSFGRISGCTGNRALRGFRRLRGRYAPLQSLARSDAPQGVDIVPMIDTLAADFELIFFG